MLCTRGNEPARAKENYNDLNVGRVRGGGYTKGRGVKAQQKGVEWKKRKSVVRNYSDQKEGVPASRSGGGGIKEWKRRRREFPKFVEKKCCSGKDLRRGQGK